MDSTDRDHRTRSGSERTGAASAEPTTAGIAPESVAVLQSFLDDHDAAAYQLTTNGDGETTETLLVASLSPLERTAARPAVRTTFEYERLPPGAGRGTIAFDAIQHVRVVDPPDELLRVSGATASDRGSALKALARIAPEKVDVPEVLDLLASEDESVRAAAIRALQHVAEDRPGDIVGAVPLLRDALIDDPSYQGVVQTLATLATTQPADIAPLADRLIPELSARDRERRRAAARCLSELGGHDPADIVAAAPDLVELIEAGGPGIGYATYALNRIAAENPTAAQPAVGVLESVLTDDSYQSSTRLNAAAGLGRIAKADPAMVVGSLDSVSGVLAADEPRLRANGAGIFADVAETHAGALEPYVEDLAQLLDEEDEYAVANATSALARVAEWSPAAVTPYTDRFIDLLEHDAAIVRTNACWALGYLRAEAAVDALHARQGDEDVEVRKRATWALAELRAVQSARRNSP